MCRRENTAGYSGENGISSLPLETCQTMNGMWGYKVEDTDYKDSRTLVRYLVKTAGMGANLLLNIYSSTQWRVACSVFGATERYGEMAES